MIGRPPHGVSRQWAVVVHYGMRQALRQRGYHHRIPEAAPLRALIGVHTPIVVIRESGLTIIVLELELACQADF